MNILIIEDDPTMRKVLGAILEDYGSITFAANGAEGVKSVNAALDENEHFDLICLDIMMPQMSGKEALKLIREVETRHNSVATKVFIVSALTSNISRKEFMEDENILFIEKPFKKNEVTERVKELIDSRV